MTLVSGPLSLRMVASFACCDDFSFDDGQGGDFGWGGGWVVGAEVGAGEDVAVDIDDVGRLLRVGAGG